MSDAQAAGAALGIPPELAQRSAAARAAVDGVSIDDLLAAWSGGAEAPAPTAPAPAPEAPAAESPAAEPAAEPEAAPVAVAVLDEPTSAVAPEPEWEPEPEEPLEPVSLGTRVKTAVRVGAWTGAALGVIGFLVAAAFWAPNTTIIEDGGPVVQVSPTGILIGAALVSIVFGAIVAGVSRAATGWTNPAMQLSSSKAGTAWLGAALGLILGLVGGAVLNGFGTPVEGSDPALVQLPVLPTLFVMLIGGAILGALTALVPQFLGVPVAVDDSDTEEVAELKGRLGGALSIPVVGLIILLVLVLPFAYALIQSNHLAPGVGGAIVAILTASGILGFAALAGSKPDMRISFGDVIWALVGIGAVLVIVISVLLYTSDEDHAEEDHAEGAAAVVQLI